MNNQLSKFALICLLIFAFSNASAQHETDILTTNTQKQDTIKQDQVVIIEMKNGDTFKGTVYQMDNEKIRLITENGELNLIASNVSTIENYYYKGKFPFPNVHDTRYFFGPSGIPIKKGNGYYQNILVTSNFVNYGITKNISIGGGFEFLSTVTGNPIWFLTPKIGFDITDKIHVGGGFIMAGVPGEGSATLGYGVFTYGNAETNLSIGAGYGFLDGEVSDYPAIMISGTHRIHRNIALLTENYKIPGNTYFGIHGIRILSTSNSFDIGAIVIPEIVEYIPALPYVGYVRAF